MLIDSGLGPAGQTALTGDNKIFCPSKGWLVDRCQKSAKAHDHDREMLRLYLIKLSVIMNKTTNYTTNTQDL